MSRIDNIHTVLFDLDETLIEPTQSFEETTCGIYEHFRERLGGVTRERFWKAYWYKAVDMWWMMKEGRLDGETARLYSFVNTLRYLRCDTALAEEMEALSFERIVQATRLKPDADGVLDRIRSAGMTIGIVTNGYTAVQHGKIFRHALDTRVDFFIASEEAGSHKPDAVIFNQALKKASAAARETVFVGDTPSADIQGARTVEMHAVLVDPVGKWADGGDGSEVYVEPHFTIESLTKLLPIVGLA